MEHMNITQNKCTNNIINNMEPPDRTKEHTVMPYMQGLCESIKTICKKYGIHADFKGSRTLKDILLIPKDKKNRQQKGGIIYWDKCKRLKCDKKYIGESGRAFEERFREHFNAPSSIHVHQSTTDHTTTLDN